MLNAVERSYIQNLDIYVDDYRCIANRKYRSSRNEFLLISLHVPLSTGRLYWPD